MKVDIAELKKRWQVRSALAITLESGRMVVDLVVRDNGASASPSFSLPFGAEAVIADPEKAGQELAAQLAAAGIRERRSVICIPPGWALTASTDLPEIASEDLRGYLELRAEREFPIAVSDLRLAHCAYTLPDGKRRATLAAVAAKRLVAVERMLEVAGYRAVSISLGVEGCRSQAEAPAALHFLANGNHVDVVIAAGGGIAALRSLPGPTSAGEHGFDAGSFCRDVRIALGGLPDAVRQQLHAARFGGAPAAAETLCSGIRQQLERMGIESPACAPPRAGHDHVAHVGAASDAATSHLLGKPLAFEFVPPQTNRWQTLVQRFDSRRRRWFITAALALIVLPVLLFLIRSNIESGLSKEWNGMSKSVGEIETLQQKIRLSRPWFEPVPRGLQLLEGMMAAFPEQGEVWAKSVQITDASKVTCEGFARNQPALVAFLERLRGRPDVTELQVQQVRGENPVQFSLTYKWEARDAK